MPMIEVPAHVQHDGFVQNKVQVQGGTNWDLSRSAVETPIHRVADPTPKGYTAEHQMPTTAPATLVYYRENSVLLSKSDINDLKALPKKSTVTVAGHADVGETKPAALAQRRAAAVAAQLKRQGHKVAEVRSFGDEVLKTYDSGNAQLNRRVEVFVK